MAVDPTRSTATELLAALERGELSSAELLEQLIERIERLDGELNVVVAKDYEGARAAAARADAARARGERLGPLHGLPMTVKDTWEVPGMPCAAGASEYRDHRPTRAASSVQRLMDAGAIVFGKTNVPYLASDLQAYNEVYGVTRNPWDPERTPGGSSGGSAASVAAGFSPVEHGSDIAGSIRTPAHWCGVYGHKPTYGVVSMRGHVPGPPGTLGEAPLVVAGPLARSATDLRLLLDIVAGPPPERSAWSVTLPEPPAKELADYRVLLWVDDDYCPIDPELRRAYEALGAELERQGVQVDRGAPEGVSLDSLYREYMLLLGTVMGTPLPARQRRVMGLAGKAIPRLSKLLKVPAEFGAFLEGMDARAADAAIQREKVARQGAAFAARTFERYDVLLMPAAIATAIRHDHSKQLAQRMVQVGGRTRSYTELFVWIALATLYGLPATSAPVGVSTEGLPFNVQIVGGPHRDHTTIRFAELIAPLTGGWRAPARLG